MKKIIKNSKSQFSQSYQSAFQSLSQLLFCLSLSFVLAACGSQPKLPQDQNSLFQKQDFSKTEPKTEPKTESEAQTQANAQDEAETQATAQDEADAEAQKINTLALKSQCISKKIENVTFASVLEDTQKYVVQFIQFYEMISQNGTNLELILQRSQYLIQFNQSLFKYLDVIEAFSKKCDPSVFNFIEYRKQLTDYIDGVIQKHR